MTATPAYLSLGSNVGDRLENLRQACRGLESAAIRLRLLSSVYETEPVDYVEQDWFLNCVVEIETDLTATQLLDRVHEIEAQLGRRRERPKGPRTVDIDILLYGDAAMRSEQLVLPHPRMLERRFVLEPLLEIAPSLRLPPSGQTVEQIVRNLHDPAQVRRVGPLDRTLTE